MQYSVSIHSSIYFHYSSTFLLELITLYITKTIPVTDKNFLSTEQTSCLFLHSFPAWKFITLKGRKPIDLFLTYTCKILACNRYLACWSTKRSSLLYRLHNLVSTRAEVSSLRFCLKRLSNMNINKTKKLHFLYFLIYLYLHSTISWSTREKIYPVSSHSASQVLLTQL